MHSRIGSTTSQNQLFDNFDREERKLPDFNHDTSRQFDHLNGPNFYDQDSPIIYQNQQKDSKYAFFSSTGKNLLQNNDRLFDSSQELNKNSNNQLIITQDYEDGCHENYPEQMSYEISFDFNELVSDSQRKNMIKKKNNGEEVGGLIELGDIGIQRQKNQIRKALTVIGTAQSTNNQDENFSTSNQNSSIFRSITYDDSNNDTKQNLSTANSITKPRVQSRFRCLNGIFLRYMMYPKLSLRHCLIIIMMVDIIIAVSELINYISAETNNIEPYYYVLSYLIKFVILVPIIIFEVLVIRYYKLNHAKMVYGLKLAVGISVLLTHILFYTFEICPFYERITDQRDKNLKFSGSKTRNSENQSKGDQLTVEEDINVECEKTFVVLTILLRFAFTFMSCWIYLSVVYWIRRGRINLILGIKTKNPNLLKINTRLQQEFEYDHEKQKLYEKDRLAIPTKVDLERQKIITNTVSHINKYTMTKKQKSSKNNFRRLYSMHTQIQDDQKLVTERILQKTKRNSIVKNVYFQNSLPTQQTAQFV
eukprot:403353772